MNIDLIDFTRKLLEALNREYKEKLVMLYPDAYSENPEAFPLADITNIDAYIIKGDEKLLRRSYHVLLYQGTGKIEDIGEIPKENYSELRKFVETIQFISNEINKIKHSDKKPYYLYLSDVSLYLRNKYQNPEEYINLHAKSLSDEMLEQLRKDGYQFLEHLDKEASYYAKNAFRYAYSELDFSSIITAVNDQDFEYALNESIACYDQSLYLAAVSTAGTALENLIIRILETKNEYTDDNSITELGVLSGRLRNLGVIDKREKKRIMLAASFRNLASHANKGRVTRQDAKLVYQEIFNLASKAFSI